jgi:serpin B
MKTTLTSLAMAGLIAAATAFTSDARVIGAGARVCGLEEGLQRVPSARVEPIVSGIHARSTGTPQMTADRPSEVNTNDFTRAADEFALELLRSIEGAGNLACSPASVHLALMLSWAGAEGETARELARVLRLVDRGDGEQWDRAQALAAAQTLLAGMEGGRGGPMISVANALMHQQGHPFRDEYLRDLEECLAATLLQVDFAGDPQGARDAINAWISEATASRIEDMVTPTMLNAATRMVLANAVTFDARWVDAFREAATGPAPFRTHDGRTVSVPTMHRTNYHRILETERFQVLELDYRIGEGEHLDDRWSMLFLLPREGVKLAHLTDELTPEVLARWSAEMEVARVHISLPRFQIQSRTDLGPILARMGLASALDQDRADFSGIDGGAGQLFIDLVIHQADVSVDEHGTEAAAATVVTMKIGCRANPPLPTTFHADRPFLFLVRKHSSGRILFAGRVADPQEGRQASQPSR